MTQKIMKRDFVPLSVMAVALVGSGCRTPGEIAAVRKDSVQLQEIMSRPNHGNENLESLMEASCESACTDCAALLFRAGASAPSYCLQQVAMKGSEKFARLLIEHGADADEEIADIQRQSSGIVKIYEPEQAQLAIDLIRRVAHQDQAGERRPTSASVEVPSSNSRIPLVPSFHQPEHPSDYALIIGIEKYADLPAATYAEADAESAKQFVLALGVPQRNVAMLTGARATRAGLAKQLEGWLANNVNESSTVYFYYSGHGAPDPKSGDAYLVPIDGDPQYLDQTAYPLKRVYEKLNALKAKRVIVMLDSCFSGAGGRSVLAKGARPLVSKVDIGSTDVNTGKISVLAAAGGDQISGTSDENGHGLFTYYLLSGLNGAADPAGEVTLKSLYGYLKPKVMDDAKRANREQTPQLLCDGESSGTVLRSR